MKFIDPGHPFYKPLWIRLVIVAVCVGWTALEFYNNEEMWGTIFLVVSAYATAQLLLFYKPSSGAEEPPKQPTDE
ncbi:hypothetical protein [Sinorhizobium sp. BG8]|uniref:hypothetical protein n=1 Tax=Sinorhizobium sp. BG8 TaxID=2613773 RepID=UPI00193DA92D|nr:hypothetical protein [Sinorhizobium sp. BG8]QRM56391.1 hypothetical protein F3Y30_18995 [Sinorhizobium sp. BG8]